MKSSFPIANSVERTSAQANLPRAGVLHEIFETQADRRPNVPAVIFGRDEAPYARLERHANRLARHLRRRGVGRESRVAMLLPRSVEAYASMLAILKAGAAYVPIEPENPADRIAYILKDSRARALITTAELARCCAKFAGAIVRVDTDREAIAAEAGDRLSSEEVRVSPRDLCYVIYTSGSTGRPKGVMVEHRNARHLVEAERAIYKVEPQDRVYQGASLSFDLSVEEIWLAFAAGATLVGATPEMAHAGPDLSRFLTESSVTVLSCVPTLLSMLAEDVPTLRLLIFGGEVCPDGLVARWARPGRRMMNTYGPTETTVIATYAELSSGRPVTIGRAVPGYRVYLLDERLQPVPRGEAGEICIGGAGVARGYMGLPDQTWERFVPDPFAPPGNGGARIYRTGDRGRFNPEGNLEFLGRADGQVKLRGYRVELSEIESVLMQADGILAAACAVREDPPGVQQLVGYVVPRNGDLPDEERIRARLRRSLPAYMVPALIETVDELPLLSSGKLDRASLPAPRPRQGASGASPGGPRTGTERHIAEVWARLFGSKSVPRDADFFLDLGGHSLLAARMVSELRKDARFATVSVANVYEHPTVASLAAALDGRAVHENAAKRPTTASPSAAQDRVARPGEALRHFLAGALETAGLYFVFALRAFEWVTPYLVYFLLLASGHSALESAAWAVASAMAVFPALTLAAVAAKWMALGRARPGRYPLWGAYYLRWWFAHSLISAAPLHYLGGTPLLPFVCRLLGARVGRDVHLSTDKLAAFDLISIGDGSSIDDDASLLGYTVEGREMVVGPVTVGRGCFVGARSVLREGAVLEDGARLEDLSLLPAGGRVPAGETWGGSPAQPISKARPAAAPPARGPFQRVALAALYASLILAFPVVLFAAILPGMALLIELDPFRHPFFYLLAAPVVGASFVVLLSTEAVLFKWLLLGRARPGTYPVHGGFYIRNWMVDQLLALSLDLIGPIHATLFVAPWYRALGAKLGHFVELSTATATTPDLLELGDESTVADEVSLGVPHIERGWMTVAPTRLGHRAFLGNSAVVKAGTKLAEGSLVGVLSIAPADSGRAARPGATWLGSPPILLPHREPSANFSEQRTFRPSRKLRLARGSFEILRVTLPPAGFILLAATLLESALALWRNVGLAPALLLLPAVYGACCAAVLLVTALAKWALVGRFKTFARPLWSNFVWRLELQNALYEFLATPLALDALKGTPLLPWYLRLLGARIGRQTYMATTGFLEFDLVEIGDCATLAADCVLQTHLFEDRVLKSSGLRVGPDCTVGEASVVLYDSRMEDGARLDALSLLMKGETLPAGTAWAGIPAQPATEPLKTHGASRAA